MILSPMNVELTKVHYYESFRKNRNSHVSSVGEMIDNKININIKRNIFGQKSWTFNVQPQPSFKQDKKRIKVSTLIVVLCFVVAIVVAAATLTVAYIRNNSNKATIIPIKSIRPGRVIVFDHAEINVENILRSQRQQSLQNREYNANIEAPGRKVNSSDNINNICGCKASEVCLRESDGYPRCKTGKDSRDPSGCAGLCLVNLEHCRLLDRRMQVFECVPNGGGLHCPLEYFNCENQLCLHLDSRCNGRVDCGDMSDEENCSCKLEHNFHCGNNTSCLPNWKRCDGKPDCWDNSDEINCKPPNSCAPGTIPCANSTECYQLSQFCDGVVDCTDESDEICAKLSLTAT